jgi:hypothetical protein
MRGCPRRQHALSEYRRRFSDARLPSPAPPARGFGYAATLIADVFSFNRRPYAAPIFGASSGQKCHTPFT